MTIKPKKYEEYRFVAYRHQVNLDNNVLEKFRQTNESGK